MKEIFKVDDEIDSIFGEGAIIGFNTDVEANYPMRIRILDRFFMCCTKEGFGNLADKHPNDLAQRNWHTT